VDQPLDLVGVTEIGQLLNVSRQRADQLTRVDGFPPPVGEISAGRIWRRSDVEAWARDTGRIT
jgi:prophage regulatory protein